MQEAGSFNLSGIIRNQFRSCIPAGNNDVLGLAHFDSWTIDALVSPFWRLTESHQEFECAER